MPQRDKPQLLGEESARVDRAPGARRARWWIPALIFVLALVFRGAYLREASALPDFAVPQVDAGYHDYWAWGMVSGDWTPPPGMPDPAIESTPYFRPPLVVFWMAGLFELLGHDHLGARVAQILLGASSCVLVYLLGRRLFGWQSGLVAGTLSASYWILVYFDTEYREVSLLVFLFLWLTLALLRYRDAPSLGRAWPIGLALGLSILAKPNGLLLLPALLLWMVLVTRARQERAAWSKQLALVLLAIGACVLPVSLRNRLASGEFVLISSNGGINFLIGNNELTDGTRVCLPPGIAPFNSAFDYPEVVRSVEARVGRSLSHAEVSGWFTRQALQHIRLHPLATLGLWSRKLAAFWAADEIVSEKDLVASRRESSVLRLVPLDFAALLASALLGLWLALRAQARAASPQTSRHAAGAGSIDRGGVWLVVGFVLLFALSFTPFFVTARYRAPIVPLLLLFSGFGLWRTFELWRARCFGAGLACLLAMGGLYYLDHYDALGYVYDPAKTITERGALLALEGKTDAAEAAFRESVALSPDNAMARNNLGLFLLEAGRPSDAAVELRRSIELDPRDYRARQNLGLCLLDLRQTEAALEQFQAVLSMQPRNAELAAAAAEALRAHALPGPARAFFEKSLELDPNLLLANLGLGLTYLGVQQPEDATPYLVKATSVDPLNAVAFNLLGVAYAQSGRRELSLAAFQSAVQLAPANVRFRENLERARSGGSAGR